MERGRQEDGEMRRGIDGDENMKIGRWSDEEREMESCREI